MSWVTITVTHSSNSIEWISGISPNNLIMIWISAINQSSESIIESRNPVRQTSADPNHSLTLSNRIESSWLNQSQWSLGKRITDQTPRQWSIEWIQWINRNQSLSPLIQHWIESSQHRITDESSVASQRSPPVLWWLESSNECLQLNLLYFSDLLAKSHMAPRYQYAKTIQRRTNGKRRRSRDRNMTPPTTEMVLESSVSFIRLDLLLTAIGFTPGDSVQYTSTKNTNTTQRKNNKTKHTTITRNIKIKSNHTEPKTNIRQSFL
jgi:hypothetical protein